MKVEVSFRRTYIPVHTSKRGKSMNWLSRLSWLSWLPRLLVINYHNDKTNSHGNADKTAVIHLSHCPCVSPW